MKALILNTGSELKKLLMKKKYLNGRGDDAKPFNAAYVLFYCNLSH